MTPRCCLLGRGTALRNDVRPLAHRGRPLDRVAVLHHLETRRARHLSALAVIDHPREPGLLLADGDRTPPGDLAIRPPGNVVRGVAATILEPPRSRRDERAHRARIRLLPEVRGAVRLPRRSDEVALRVEHDLGNPGGGRVRDEARQLTSVGAAVSPPVRHRTVALDGARGIAANLEIRVRTRRRNGGAGRDVRGIRSPARHTAVGDARRTRGITPHGKRREPAGRRLAGPKPPRRVAPDHDAAVLVEGGVPPRNPHLRVRVGLGARRNTRRRGSGDDRRTPRAVDDPLGDDPRGPVLEGIGDHARNVGPRAILVEEHVVDVLDVDGRELNEENVIRRRVREAAERRRALDRAAERAVVIDNGAGGGIRVDRTHRRRSAGVRTVRGIDAIRGERARDAIGPRRTDAQTREKTQHKNRNVLERMHGNLNRLSL